MCVQSGIVWTSWLNALRVEMSPLTCWLLIWPSCPCRVPQLWPNTLRSHLSAFSNSAEPGCEETRLFFGNEKLNTEQTCSCLLTPCFTFTSKERRGGEFSFRLPKLQPCSRVWCSPFCLCFQCSLFMWQSRKGTRKHNYWLGDYVQPYFFPLQNCNK